MSALRGHVPPHAQHLSCGQDGVHLERKERKERGRERESVCMCMCVMENELLRIAMRMLGWVIRTLEESTS